jgi:hypothetical protein
MVHSPRRGARRVDEAQASPAVWTSPGIGRPGTRLADMRQWALRTGLVLAAVVPLASDARVSRREADSLERKILAMAQYATSPLEGARLTPVTETELNSYLNLALADQLPPGVTEPAVSMLGDGRVAGRAVVDLDAFRRARGSQGRWGPTALLSGRLRVGVEGVLHTARGVARFDLRSADIEGMPIPKVLVAELVAFYTRGAEYPSGVDIDAPFALPARIAEIHVNERQAVVVQR